MGQYLVTIGVGTANRLDDAKFPQVRHGRCVQRLRDDDYAHQGAEECADIHVQPYAGVGDPVVAGDVPPFGFAVDIVVGQAAAQFRADRRDVRAGCQLDDDVGGPPGQGDGVDGLGNAIIHEHDRAGGERDRLAGAADDFQAVFHNFPVFADGKRAEIGARRGLRLRTHFETSSELGGDLWTVFELDQDRLGVLIVDFAGHGITAAINTFRLHTLIERIPPQGQTPSEWLSALNLALKDVLPTGQFATAFYCVLDVAADTLTYATAGSPNPVLIVTGSEPVLIDSAGYLLGISRRSTYHDLTRSFPPGSRLFLYSDALIECPDSTNRTLGQDGVIGFVQGAIAERVEDPVGAMLDGFLAGIPRPLRDDLTAIWIERT
ncbi:phosphoserine phosphatase RsbU/P [uncultured Gammaproteobacteria bacterium]